MAKTVSVIYWSDESVHAFSIALRAGQAQIVRQSTTPYRVPDSLFASSDLSGLITASVKVLQDVHGAQDRVTLLLPMQWCFLQILHSRNAAKSDEQLAYEFEPYLPVALEDVTCVFAKLSDDRHLAAAIPTQPMLELLDQFAAAGIEIDHIAIDTLVGLDLQGHSDKSRSLIIQDTRWVRAILWDPNSSALLSSVLSADQEGIEKILLSRFGDFQEQHLNPASVLDITARDPSLQKEPPSPYREIGFGHHLQLSDLANMAAKKTPEIDFRAGELSGRRKLDEISNLARQCMALAAFLFVVIAASLLVKNRLLKNDQQQIEGQKFAVYRQVFETPSLPTGAAMRLASERVRLEGLSRTDLGSVKSKDAVLPLPFEVLRNVVEALPQDVPVLLNETRIDEHQLVLRGQTREHRDAERIVEAINKVSGIKALAPRTNRLKTGGVEFAINAGAGNGQ